MKRLILLYCITAFGFLLGVHGGRIALWEDGKADPVKVFPYSASMLPRQDQERLEQGMHFESKEALIKAIEDYLS